MSYFLDELAAAMSGGGDTAGVVAPAFSTETAYSAGKLVIYDKLLYRAKVDVTAGEWDATKWEQTTAGEELAQKYTKPTTGIPKTDLDSDVQESLRKADDAVRYVPQMLTDAEKKQAIANIGHYDGLYEVKDITNTSITMGEVADFLDEVNTAGNKVAFNLAAFNSMMFLCTIYIDRVASFVRVADQVTGFEKKTFFKNSDKLADILNGISTQGKHYTIAWDKTNSQCTRLNDAQNITTNTANFGHFGSVNASYENPFDSIYPWSGRKLCNIDINTYYNLSAGADITDCVTYWEDDEGFSYDDPCGVWVYTPAFFGRTFEAGNYRYFDVTEELTQGNVSYPAMITGRWHGQRKTLTVGGAEKTCFIPAQGLPSARYAMSTMHTEAKNYKGTLTDIYKVDASNLLMIVEYASLNSQIKVGNGVSDLYRQSSDLIAEAGTDTTVVKVVKANAAACIPGAIFDIGTSNGSNNVGTFIVQSTATDPDDSTLLDVTLDRAVTVTAAHFWSVHGKINTADAEIGSKSGYIGTNGKSIAYYRGEELWSNMFQYILGAYREKDTDHIWVCDRNTTDNYDGLNTTDHHDVGYAIGAAEGCVGKLGLADGLCIPPFCTQNGGNSTNPVGDYFYRPASTTVNTILILGGYAADGPRAGAFCGYWAYAASSSRWNLSARPALKTP